MRTFIILLTFIIHNETAISQGKIRSILLNSDWILTSGETRAFAFLSDTLKFINCSGCQITDSIMLNPKLRLSKLKNEFMFSFSFCHKLDTTSSGIITLGGWNSQYGYWSLDNSGTDFDLTLLVPNDYSDNMNTWTVKSKLKYKVEVLSSKEFIIVKCHPCLTAIDSPPDRRVKRGHHR